MKPLFILLLALLSTSLSMAAELVGDTITVYNASDFIEAIKNNNDANIKLGDDIQLGVLDSRICDTFTGSINGYYQANDSTGELQEYVHTIYGDTDRQVKWSNIEMFGTVDGAEFRDLLFVNIFVETKSHSNTGLIAREARNSTFFDVTFEKVKVSCNNDDAGIIAGHADNCNFGVVTTKACDVYTAGIEAGGLVGKSENCNFEMCITHPASQVYADGRTVAGGAYVGGFSGKSVRDKFWSCINAATVGGAENKVGGYTGQSLYSEFTSCANSGYVGHCRHDLFVEYAEKKRGRMESWTDNESFATITGILGMGASIGLSFIASHVFSSVASRVVEYSFGYYQWARDFRALTWYHAVKYTFNASKYSGYTVYFSRPEELFLVKDGFMRGANLAGYAEVVLQPLAIVLAIELAATIAWTIYEGDDEAGGISAHAQGGFFESCTNRGELICKDDNCGGIVGLGQGVTINNCFNSGQASWDEHDTTGGILGKAEPDKENAGKKCLVTNCLSSWAFHIVGDYQLADGLDPASGNNYRMEGGKGDPVNCEMQINKQQLESGIVAMWLNQGVQNRSKGTKAWRQNLVVEVDSLRDICPIPDITHAEVTIDVLAHDTITTADQLIAFAKKVNEQNQFACAVLDADIDMSGKTWTPIGKDGFFTNFRGIFDGRGHTISGLKCESDQALGLFGTVHSGAEICNVNIGADCEFTGTGNSGVGAIVGEVPIGWHWGNVVIENCGNYGKVNGKNDVNAGGILGKVRNNTEDAVKVMVNNCFNMGTITAAGNSALLCGYMRNSGVVTNCWSGGELHSLTSSETPYDATQGRPEYFVGYMDNLDIENCYAIDPLARVQGLKDEAQKEQRGVAAESTAFMTSGELAYDLNKGVIDGTQPWYQKLGPDGDAQPVRTKLPDGTNMVFSYPNIEGNIDGFANTSREEIADVITGKTRYKDHPVTDINYQTDPTRKVDVADLVRFIAAAIR